MNNKTHTYQATVTWTGNLGKGTSSYRAYGRDYSISANLKADIFASADPAFRGNACRWNPEELLLASASGCHQLWYLHLCADAGICVIAYKDHVTGTMIEGPKTGAFKEITLHPVVKIRDITQKDLALSLHYKAHELCYIANSVNFPIYCEAKIVA